MKQVSEILKGTAYELYLQTTKNMSPSDIECLNIMINRAYYEGQLNSVNNLQTA